MSFGVFCSDKNAALSSQRRLERKLKEMSMTLDEDRQQITEQRDQVSHTHTRGHLFYAVHIFQVSLPDPCL